MAVTRIWQESVAIPTYRVYPPEKNPLFLERRAYQGSSGSVYPLQVTEKISDEKEDVSYEAVFLENEYLKVMVLPELGGRIQRAYDKTNGYDFVYYNHVIKPALVGLTGPWISGGIEFNWPQHHRPTTFSPVEYTMKTNEDGSVTVYVGETDRMYGTKGMAAISLYPGKAYIEIRGQLYNGTDLPQTFLWWANPAVPVNDYTYSVFPPDVNAVMDHGKRAVSTFPIATGEYYKADYSAGVDISRYKNIKVPTSYMAAHSDYDFVGNYDEKRQAGLLHVADHRVSPGKKQWTWGSGDFGKSWDKNLTDEDGPYIELMTGVFCDNQPDFSWLKPHEEKTFVQYFMPYKGVGRVGNATKEAAVGLASENGRMLVRVYTTGVYEGAEICVEQDGRVCLKTAADLSPEKCFEAEIPGVDAMDGCTAKVCCGKRTLVSYEVYKKEPRPIPEAAETMLRPEAMKSNEELYLAGQHLEQYRHASYAPEDYYLEGLKRDAGDLRINDAYGQLLYKRGRIAESIPYFETAVKKATWKNPNPYAGEAHFHLGMALMAAGEDEKAYDAFAKAVWSAEVQNPGFYRMACLKAKEGCLSEALELSEKSLVRNWHDMKARTLKAALLRRTGRPWEAFLAESLSIDPLSLGCLFEKAQAENDFAAWRQVMRGDVQNYLELALDYAQAGLYEEAVTVLQTYDAPAASPLKEYYLGWIYGKQGKTAEAVSAFEAAEKGCPDGCFPNRVEEIEILETAVKTLGEAPMAHYYLGNLLYSKKQYESAAEHWEAAVAIRPIPAAWRNLSIAYFNKKKDPQNAMIAMKSACALDKDYPRLWLEYDQLAARMNRSCEERLKVMESHMDITKARDDLYLRYITLLNNAGRFDEALAAVTGRRFHPWEGGEGKSSAQYKYALIHLAKKSLEEKKPEEAISCLERTLTYPENLGEGKLPNVPDNEAYYYMGLARRMQGDEMRAAECFEKAAAGPTEPERVLYYNDQPSDFIYFQGLANRALGREAAARGAFNRLISFGERHLFDKAEPDFFAVSLPEIEVYQDDMQLRNTQYCNYLRALGEDGLGHEKKARELFDGLLERQCDYQGVRVRD